MAYYSIGHLVAEMRRRRGVSQEELAAGICSVSTVSKIENGIQTPSRKVCEGLLQRLGVSAQSYGLYIGDTDLRKSEIEEQIMRSLASGRYEEAEVLLQQYESMEQKRGENVMEKQFCLYVRGCLEQEQHKNLQLAEEMLLQAIRLSIPQLDLEHMERIRLLMNEEIIILHRLANLFHETGSTVKAKRIQFFLKEYLETVSIENFIIMQIYPKIISKLACWMEQDGRFEDELELSECGLDACVKWGRLTEYPMLLETKGYALLALNRVEEAVTSLKQACTIFRSIGDPVRAGLVKSKAEALFQIHHESAGQHQPMRG